MNKINKKKSCVLLLLVFLFPIRSLVAKQDHLLPKEILELLASEISGEEAFQTVVLLGGAPRIRPEKEYKGTFYEADYLLQKAREYGLENTHIEYFPWQYDCWDPISAGLWLIDPGKRKLTGLEMVHLCLIENSTSVDVTTELIDVGKGTSNKDYEGKDVKGKIVLSSGNIQLVNTQAVHLRGASGIVSYYSMYPNEYPDMVSWGAFVQPYYGSDEKYTFGFMISPRQGQLLKELLIKHKKVLLRAKIDTRTHPGKLDVVQTVIKGTDYPDEEIMLMAHLFEYYYKQGANDNKSGSAAILEIARTVNKLIRERSIQSPRRSLRFFWEPEGYGTFAWLEKYPESVTKLKAVIDMDMVGESHLKCGSVFQVLGTPDSFPHFFNDVVQHFAEYIASKSGIGERTTNKSFPEIIASPTGSRAPFYHQIIHFNPRMYNENWLAVPHILFHCGPDPFYHSSEDRPDKCDPTQLKRAAFLGAAATLYMANLSPEDIPQLTAVVLGAGEKRLAKDIEKALSLLSNSEKKEIHSGYKEARNVIQQGILREKKVLASIGDYLHLPADECKKLVQLISKKDPLVFSPVERYYSFLCQKIGQKKKILPPTEVERRLDQYYPERTLGLEFLTDFTYLERVLNDDSIKEKLEIYKTGRQVPWEALNFADGTKSILEIRNALCAEFSPIDITHEMVEDYFVILEKARVVKIKRGS